VFIFNQLLVRVYKQSNKKSILSLLVPDSVF